MKKIIRPIILLINCLVLSLLFPLQSRAQALLDWAHGFGSNNIYGIDQAYDVAIDNQNNVYITGSFQDSVDFDPGSGEAIYFYSENNTHPAAFLAKYSSAGDFVWVVTAGSGSANAKGTSVNFDNDGNVLWTGSMNGSIDFDPGTGVHQISGGFAIFVAKYDADGNYILAFALSGFNYTTGKQIFSDAANNIVVLGYFQGAVDFDPSGSSFTITAVNNYGDLFFAKYSSTGNFLSAKSINAKPAADNFDYGEFAAQDNSGNVFIAGVFLDSCDFDPGPGVTQLTSATTDIYFVKYDADFNLQWVKQITGNDQKVTHALTLDASGNIYLTGWFRNTMDADPGSGTFNLEAPNSNSDDIFFAKYTSTGDLTWAKTIGGDGYDYARSINVDGQGSVYVTGDFYMEVDFDPGPGEAILTTVPLGDNNIYIALYDNNGNYLNASNVQGGDFSEGRALNMEFDASGNFYLGGFFTQTADFDCTAGQYNLVSGGDYDIFLAKYDSIIVTPISVQEINEPTLAVFPNPASQTFYITVPPEFLSGKILIKDVNGKIIYSNSVSSETNFSVDASSLPGGIYSVQLIAEKKIASAKLVVVH